MNRAVWLAGFTAALALALAGCSTCVSVDGTYVEVWAVTKAVMEAIPEQSADVPACSFQGRGTIDVVSTPRQLGGELHHHARIEPVGSTEVRSHKVCIAVRHLERGVDQNEAIHSRRRQDLERLIADAVARRLAGGGPADVGGVPPRAAEPQRQHGQARGGATVE